MVNAEVLIMATKSCPVPKDTVAWRVPGMNPLVKINSSPFYQQCRQEKLSRCFYPFILDTHQKWLNSLRENSFNFCNAHGDRHIHQTEQRTIRYNQKGHHGGSSQNTATLVTDQQAGAKVDINAKSELKIQTRRSCWLPS